MCRRFFLFVLYNVNIRKAGCEMKILYDYHMHSEISPDAHFTMEEMCESAIEKGMREIVFTDHYEFYVHGVVRPWFNEEYVEKYFRTLEECRKKFEGRLSVKSGMEFGQLYISQECNEIVQKYPFDFVLGSVHKLENIDLTNLIVTEKNARSIGDAYYYHLLELSEEGDFDCLAHMDYFKKHCAKQGISDFYEEYQPMIKKVLENVIRRGKGIEINTAGMGSILEDTMPGMDVLKMYKELGGTIITAGSDSHRPDRIGYGFDKVYQMLKKAGFNSISVYKNRKNIQQPI